MNVQNDFNIDVPKYDVAAWANFEPHQIEALEPAIICGLLRYASSEIERLQRLTIKDSDGDVVTQGTFNVLIWYHNELRNAIDRGGCDVFLCGTCKEPVVCLPDELPLCEGCVAARQEHRIHE